LLGAVLLYLIWRFLQVYIANLGGEMEGIGRLLRYFAGVLLELLLVWGLAQLNFRYIFLRFAATHSRYRNWYWGWIGMFALLCFAWLEWRTFYEPEFVDENVLSTILLTAFVVAYAYSADYFRTRRLQLTLLKEKTEAELHALNAQINPHFLFNTLNILYNSAQKNDDEPTAKLVHELSHLLRFSIQESRMQLTDLGKELAFLNRYVRFQRLRLPEKPEIDVQISVPEVETDVHIAPLLLLPFVENAFQYGISLNENCFVHLDIQFEKGVLTMKLQNSIVPHSASKKSLGTGIQNVRERLKLLYPRQHILEIQTTEHEFTVLLELNLYPINSQP